MLAREIIQKSLTSEKSLTLDRARFVDFNQMFGTLVSFSYYFVLVLCIFNKILKLLFLKLLTIFPCKNPCSKKFLDIKFLFVNRFSKFLWHILGQTDY